MQVARLNWLHSRHQRQGSGETSGLPREVLQSNSAQRGFAANGFWQTPERRPLQFDICVSKTSA